MQTNVDTKRRAGENFGNNGAVDTKSCTSAAFGNDGNRIGFIRVRKRKLKGGHPSWRAARAGMGRLASTSISFDLVRGVRVGGKPRHQFVLGLGSQKDNVTGHVAALMLRHAVIRMMRHGLDESQRRALLTELIRKGARRPSVAECEGFRSSTAHSIIDELVAWLTVVSATAEVRS